MKPKSISIKHEFVARVKGARSGERGGLMVLFHFQVIGSKTMKTKPKKEKKHNHKRQTGRQSVTA